MPRSSRRPAVLAGSRVLSLALNLPGPASLMRCREMGATCVKIEPPNGDPMVQYSASAYARIHLGVRIMTADLKTPVGQKLLHRELKRADVLMTSFRPSALARLGLGWKSLHAAYPSLSQVVIVGASGERAEEAGHDLTYMAQNGLIPAVDLPPTLYADMGGSLMATEAVLRALIRRNAGGRGVRIEVALADAVAYLALPREWGLTTPQGFIGGAHAGYRIYQCRDGRVAVAALEKHFAAALCAAAGLPPRDPRGMMSEAMIQAIGTFFSTRTREELDRLAVERDIPLYTLP